MAFNFLSSLYHISIGSLLSVLERISNFNIAKITSIFITAGVPDQQIPEFSK